MFIPCRIFDTKAGEFSPLANVIAPAHVCQANDYPLTLQDSDGSNRLDVLLISVRLASGEVVRVESTPALREALNMGPAEPALQLMFRRATASQVVQ